jgi:hypothetical protein
MTTAQFELLLKYTDYKRFSEILNVKIDSQNYMEIALAFAQQRIHKNITLHYMDAYFYILYIIEEYEQNNKNTENQCDNDIRRKPKSKKRNT